MQAITEYTRYNYRAINRNLRNGVTTEQAAELIEVVNQLPAAPGTTYRTFWVDDIAAFADELLASRKDRQPLRFDAFSSTSRNRVVAQRFNGNVKLTIEGKRGRDIAPMSDKPAEEETLYLPGLTCQIKAVRLVKVKGKVWSVEVDLIEI